MSEQVKELTDELTAEEMDSAKKHGLIEEEKPKEEEKGEEKEEQKPLDPDSFDEMEETHSQDENKFHKQYTPNAKALYFKYKRQKQLRQEAQALADKAVKDKEFVSLQTKAYQKKLNDVVQILDRIDGGDENITTKDIRTIIAFKEEQRKAEEKEEKREEKAQALGEKDLKQRSKDTFELGKDKYPDFDRYVVLCNEIVKKDKDIAYIITSSFQDPETDEAELVEKIVRYARMHPDFGKKEEVQETKETDVDRIVKNSKKKKTSASITGGSGGRSTSYDDMTLEEFAGLSREEYDKVPEAVRHKFLKLAS